MYIIQDLFIPILPTAFDAAGSFYFLCFKIEANIMNKSNDSTNTNNKEVSERIKGV